MNQQKMKHKLKNKINLLPIVSLFNQLNYSLYFKLKNDFVIMYLLIRYIIIRYKMYSSINIISEIVSSIIIFISSIISEIVSSIIIFILNIIITVSKNLFYSFINWLYISSIFYLLIISFCFMFFIYVYKLYIKKKNECVIKQHNINIIPTKSCDNDLIQDFKYKTNDIIFCNKICTTTGKKCKNKINVCRWHINDL